MAEATQYGFDWAEIAELLIKKLDIHEGEWLAVVEFGITGGMVGPSPSEAKPGMSIIANGIQLAKAQPGAPPHLIVDAAKVNPKA